MTSSTGVMLVEIDSIFSLGIRRSGYDERLKNRSESGQLLQRDCRADIRLKPVPANYWCPCTRPINTLLNGRE